MTSHPDWAIGHHSHRELHSGGGLPQQVTRQSTICQVAVGVLLAQQCGVVTVAERSRTYSRGVIDGRSGIVTLLQDRIWKIQPGCKLRGTA